MTKFLPSSRLVTVALGAALAMAQTPGPVLRLTATTDKISGAGDAIRIDILRWSTDADRDQLLAAWEMKTPAPAAPRGGRAGRGGAAPAADPAAAGNDAPAGAAAPARGGGRGGGGGGGRGRGNAVEVPRTPEASLVAALEKVPTVGYLWSSEVAGYSLRYAAKLPDAGGGERILLITDRRLGATNDRWTPNGADPANAYEFSVIDLRLNAKGEGEGKISFTGKVAVDSAAKIVAPENYGALPVVLKGVKRAQ
jgi:hypothetical protein